ncbi:hypothetical protein MXL46_19050 [Heyndrickxia sporothermodurans]|nr:MULTISPECIES: hypothetical protein [Bacillaceae]MEB6551146.1 hypothetical protein [Heyndrickxia sporothermodurans]MED3781870.1 hypothetical protein [Heyndrickxia sporothermodurans]
MNMEETSEYNYQTLIDILAEMVKNYLTTNSKQTGGEKNAESCNKSVRPA